MGQGVNWESLNRINEESTKRKLFDYEQKQKVKQALEQVILETALKNQRLKQGANLGQLDTSQGMRGVLGQIPGMFEQDPMDQFKNQAAIADMEKKIYEAGGPAPSITPRMSGVLGGQKSPQEETAPDGIRREINPTNAQLVPKGYDQFGRPTGFTNPEEELTQATKKAVAIENVKPYTEGEIKIVSGLQLIPQIDKLIKLAENKDVYEGFKVPFGASRISSFGEEGPWQSIKRGLTAGAGREAGLILQDIKQLMFSTGGQALTDPEILKLGPKMEPAYKTEKQWISDLKDVRQRIIEKARLLRPNPNLALPGGEKNRFTGKSMYEIGQTITKGGKQYRITGFDTDGEPLVDLAR